MVQVDIPLVVAVDESHESVAPLELAAHGAPLREAPTRRMCRNWSARMGTACRAGRISVLVAARQRLR